MKGKTVSAALVGKLIALSVGVVACTQVKDETVGVGVLSEPHARLLEIAKEEVKKQHIELRIVEFTNYVALNEAVMRGDILMNFFQHVPHMQQFNQEHNGDLVRVGNVHVEPLALYSRTYRHVSDFPAGAVIAIPNDSSNEARALRLLEAAGFIRMRAGSGLFATVEDVQQNVRNVVLQEVESALLPRVFDQVDGAVINGNYAIMAGLSARRDGLAVEPDASAYANVLVVKRGNEADARVQAVLRALCGGRVRTYLKERYKGGEVAPAL